MSASRPGSGGPVRDRLGPAEFAILGVLAYRIASDGEHGRDGVHGYDLSRSFTDGALAEIIRLESGMLYHYLKKLARAGLITSRVEHQEGRPDRHLHMLTARGESVLRTWLASPVRATREIRLDFLLKLYLSRLIDPALAASLIASQHDVMRTLVGSLVSQVTAIAPDAADADFHRAVLDLRLSQTRAALEWLESLASPPVIPRERSDEGSSGPAGPVTPAWKR
jgi:DNA-binding PadR family transcriptional regulator